MDETDCIVCFANYDDEDHRPRIMPCGHTNCSKCLEKAIAGNSKICPKCRTPYTASNVKELIINFSLESLVKSLNISERNKKDNLLNVVEKQSSSETNKSDSLPECAEHQMPVSDRCSTHKAWVCKSCLGEDHSTEACKIISIVAELYNRTCLQLDRAQPLQNAFEESCKKSDDCKIQCKKLIEENDTEIIRYETMVTRIQEEIKRKKSSKIEMEKNYAKFEQTLKFTKCKRSSYDQAVVMLKSSTTLRGVSKCSVEVQNEAKKLQLISDEIDNEIEQVQQAFKPRNDLEVGLSLEKHELSVRDGKTHFHALQAKNTSESHIYNIQFSDGNYPPKTEGILTFLDIAWPGQQPRRVYIKMLGNSARAKQHLLFITGQCGFSYRDLYFNNCNNVGQPGEEIIICPYDGKRAAPLLKNVTATKAVFIQKTPGLVLGAAYKSDAKNFNNSLFCIILQGDPGNRAKECFGMVESGLDVLKELAKAKDRSKIRIVDCGLVLF